MNRGASRSNSLSAVAGLALLSISRHFGINLLAPGGDAAFDALEIFEALLPQEVQRLQRTHAGFAVQIILLVRVEFGEALLDLAQKAGPVLAWGDFTTITLNFLIVAFCIFLLVKGMNALKRHEEAKPTLPPEPTAQEKLLTEIRDLLKNRP